MAMTTSKHGYRAGHQPLPSGVFVAPFPHAFSEGVSQYEAGERAVRALHHLLLSQTAPGETAAVVIEPVLGEGGYVPADPEFLRAVHRICHEHGILFVADEVQTGFGRTGDHFWGYEAHGFVPDVITVAKGVGNGVGLGAVIARAEVLDSVPANSISTFGGNPLACAGALANLDYLMSHDLQGNAKKQGQVLATALHEIAAHHPYIAEVRGRGLMLAIELCVPGTEDRPGGPQPWPEGAAGFMEATRARGLLVGKGGLYGNVLRIAPPLSVDEAELAEAIDILAAAAGEVAP
jgi:4-aminobutyrate aminotransferase-like enzyme